MQVTVREMISYNDEISLYVFLEEKVGDFKNEIFTRRLLLLEHHFYTGWFREDKLIKKHQRLFELCKSVLFNKRVASQYDGTDEIVKECARIRLEYSNVYFKEVIV